MVGQLSVEGFRKRLNALIGSGSANAFAKKCGLPESLIRKYQKGDSLPGYEKLFELAAGADVRPEWLLTGEEPMRSPAGSAGLEALRRLSDAADDVHRVVDAGAIGRALKEIGDKFAANDAIVAGFAQAIGMEEGEIRTAIALFDEYTPVPRHDVKAAAGDMILLPAEEIVDFLLFKTSWLRRELGVDPAGVVVIQAKGDSMKPTIDDGDLLMVDVTQQLDGDDGIYVVNIGGRVMVKRLQFMLDRTVKVVSDNPIYQPQVVDSGASDSFWIAGRVVWSGGRP